MENNESHLRQYIQELVNEKWDLYNELQQIKMENVKLTVKLQQYDNNK